MSEIVTIKQEYFLGYGNSPVKQYLESASKAEELLGISLRPSIAAGPEFCFHDIYKKAEPESIKGVIFPKGFKSLQPLTAYEFGEVQERLFQLAFDPSQASTDDLPDFINLFTPAIVPQKGITDLQLTTAQICKLNNGSVDDKFIEPFIVEGHPDTPIAYLPSQFESQLDDLTIDDVLTIFPEAERNLLALCIGRALVGSNGMRHVHHPDYEVSHSFRTFCLIYGFSAGTGKSTFFEFLWDAIETTGYKVAHFNSLDDYFGLGEICTQPVAYADDLLTSTLTKLLKAPLFKQMITGAKIRAKIKFMPDTEVRSQAAFFACVNDFSPNALYGLDNGTLNRLAILSTYTDFEISQLVPTGISKGSPNLRTREHITWLMNKLNVDRKAVMLKFASLCAQKFKDAIDSNTLEQLINDYKRKLRTQIHEALEYSTIQLMQFCYSLREQKSPPSLSKGLVLQTTFKHLNFIINDDRANSVRNTIKKSWVEAGKPAQHIWTAIKLLDNVSVSNCQQLELGASITNDSVKSIKAYWQDLRLASGFNLAGNIAAIKQDWSVSRNSLHQLQGLLEQCKSIAHPDVLDTTKKVDISHLNSANYDRETYINSLNDN